MKWIVLTISILLFNAVAILMPKRLKLSEIYTTVIFALLVDLLVDLYASFRFKAWGFFDPEKVEFSAALIIFGIYPAIAAMIINWYPYKGSRKVKIYYLLGWSVFSTAYEWVTLKTGILWHIHWNLFFSFLMYPFIYFMLVLHFRMYRWLKQRSG